MSDLDDVLSKAQRLTDRLIDECIKIRPGDIGGKLFARAIAEYVLDVAAKKHAWPRSRTSTRSWLRSSKCSASRGS